MGAALVIFSFLTVWELTFSLPAATFAGCLNLFGKTCQQAENIEIRFKNPFLSIFNQMFRQRHVDIEPLHHPRSADAVFHFRFGVRYLQVPQSAGQSFRAVVVVVAVVDRRHARRSNRREIRRPVRGRLRRTESRWRFVGHSRRFIASSGKFDRRACS